MEATLKAHLDIPFQITARKDAKFGEIVVLIYNKVKDETSVRQACEVDTHVISTITSHGPGYLNKDKETIVGFQTDKPFKRAMMPYGGVRMAEKACADNGYTMDPQVKEFFTVHRKTHNAGVFDADRKSVV